MGCFDPYSDDPRLGVQKIHLCKYSGYLTVAGTAGQVRATPALILQIRLDEISGHQHDACWHQLVALTSVLKIAQLEAFSPKQRKANLHKFKSAFFYSLFFLNDDVTAQNPTPTLQPDRVAQTTSHNSQAG